MRTQLNRYQVLLDGKIIYRSKNRELAVAYFRNVCVVHHPFRKVRIFDTHTKEYVERP
jgi:hypothetical protein